MWQLYVAEAMVAFMDGVVDFAIFMWKVAKFLTVIAMVFLAFKWLGAWALLAIPVAFLIWLWLWAE